MRILFCKISWMKFYKGVYPGLDEPKNGGSYVKEHGEGHECYNFDLVTDSDGSEWYLGFVETKSTRANKRNELHLEKIEGCEMLKEEPFVDDVLVVWCATGDRDTSIVGWYNHATVFRRYEETEFDNGYIQSYNILAKKEDCTLLPWIDRTERRWEARVAKKHGFGFGQSMVWYAQEDNAHPYLEKLIEQITSYKGENWIDRSVYDS